MTHLLHTTHLRLRPCQSDDLDALHELWINPDVRRFLSDDRAISRDEAQAFIDASTATFTDHGYGLWVFCEPHNQLIGGFAGLLRQPEGLPNLMFGTRPQLWGRGYATEASAAVLRYAVEALGHEHVVADVDEPNVSSIRVLEKLGMTRTRRDIVNGRPLLSYEYRPLVLGPLNP